MFVHGVPPDTAVDFRLVQKNNDKSVACSVWVSARTADVPPYVEGQEYQYDLLGNVRTSCKQCKKCSAFVCDEEGVGQNFDVSEPRCLRCGCNVTCHMDLEEEKR